jgi:signal peptidase I
LHINGEAVQLEPLGKRAFEDPEDGRIRELLAFRETLPGGVSHMIFDRGAIERGDCVDDLGVDRCRYDDTPEFEVPAGHYFMMGDDRDNSADSRAEIGMVPFDHLVGKAQFVFVSFNFKTKISDPLSLITGFEAGRFLKPVR